jgi:hypothetical protein
MSWCRVLKTKLIAIALISFPSATHRLSPGCIHCNRRMLPASSSPVFGNAG